MEHVNLHVLNQRHSPSSEEDVKIVETGHSNQQHTPSSEKEEDVKIVKIAETIQCDDCHEKFLNLHHSFYEKCELCNKKIGYKYSFNTSSFKYYIGGEVLEATLGPHANVNMDGHVKRFHPADYANFLNPPAEKLQRPPSFITPTTMSAALEPRKSYSVSAIREVDTAYCRKQLWTLVDIDDEGWWEIWAPPFLTKLVLERHDNAEIYLSQKKKERVLTSIFIYYLGYTGLVAALTSYNLHFYEKRSLCSSLLRIRTNLWRRST